MAPQLSPVNLSTASGVKLEETLSAKELCEKISKIGANQIELIGNKIAGNILDNIGTTAKARIAEQVAPSKQLQNTETNDEEQEKCLSDRQMFAFLNVLAWAIKGSLTTTFSTPQNFLESGMSLDLSDNAPIGIFKETAEKIGVKLTMREIPLRYSIYLQLDSNLTQTHSKLMFSLIEQSSGVEFSKEAFTIEDLENEHQYNLQLLTQLHFFTEL
jgi:hypothetical protein